MTGSGDAAGGEDPSFRFGTGEEGCIKSDFKRSWAGLAGSFDSSSSEDPSLSFRITLKHSNIRLSRIDFNETYFPQTWRVTLLCAISSFGNSWARARRIFLAEMVDKSLNRRILYSRSASANIREQRHNESDTLIVGTYFSTLKEDIAGEYVAR